MMSYQSVPASSEPVPTAADRNAFIARIAVTVVGGILLIVSGLVDWIKNLSGVNLTVKALFQSTFRRPNSFVSSVGFVVIVLGLLALLGLAPRSGWLTRAAGALAVAVFVLFIIQVVSSDRGVSDMQAGPWLSLVGGIVTIVGGFVASNRARLLRRAPAAPPASPTAAAGPRASPTAPTAPPAPPSAPAPTEPYQEE